MTYQDSGLIMKLLNKYSVHIALLAIFVCFTLPSHAQTTLDYIDNQTPDTRYIDHLDGTVTDRKTNLMWAKDSQGASIWVSALESAKNSTNVKELQTLIAYNSYSPSINTNLFPDTSNNNYWTSSPAVTSNSRSAISISFDNGTSTRTTRTSTLMFRLVRNP